MSVAGQMADGKTTGLENVNVGEIFSHYLFMSGTLIFQIKVMLVKSLVTIYL